MCHRRRRQVTNTGIIPIAVEQRRQRVGLVMIVKIDDDIVADPLSRANEAASKISACRVSCWRAVFPVG